MTNKIYLIFVFCYFFSNTGSSQNTRKLDSLQKQLETQIAEQAGNGGLGDSVIAKTLFALSQAYRNHDPKKSMSYLKQMLSLSEKIGFKRGMGNGYNSMGIMYMNSGDYQQSLIYFEKSLKIRIILGAKKAIGMCYGNIAIVYDLMGNQPEALKNQLTALKLFKELNDEDGIAFSLNNIGIIYEVQNKYPEAIKYYTEAIRIRRKTGDRMQLGYCLNNLANVYMLQKNYSEAIDIHCEGLLELEASGDTSSFADCYHNMSNIYATLGNYDEALKLDFAAMRIKERMGSFDMLESSYSNIGYIYTRLNNLKKATLYLNKALVLSKTISSIELKTDLYRNLSVLDSAKGDFAKAFVHYKTHIAYRDSMVNEKNTEKIMQHQMQSDFDNKQLLLKAEQDKKDKISQAAIMAHQKEKQLYLALGIFLLLAVIALWSRLNLARKTKKLMEEKNEQIRIEKEIAQQQRLRAELMDMRHKIAKDLHDDIGSSLSSISIYSELAQKITDQQMPEAAKILNNVGDIAREAMENMSDIVWTINPVNDKLDDIMQRLKLLSDHLREARNITVHFDVGENIREVKLTMNQRKNTYLIFKEAINNIAKYSGARNCYVAIKKQGELVLVSIKDDGSGFDGQVRSMGGNGLINMRQRAEEMSGSLEVKSEKDNGTEIKFQF